MLRSIKAWPCGLLTIALLGVGQAMQAADSSSTTKHDQDLPIFESAPALKEAGVVSAPDEVQTSEGIPPNMNVSGLAGNESEVSIAINPLDIRNAVIFGHGPVITTMSSFSTLDGGRTWTRVAFGAAQDGLAGCWRTDPTVTFDADGNVYVAYFTFSCASNTRTLIVARSTDGGQTYPQITQAVVDPTDQLDKEIIGTGPDPVNPNQQNVYIAYRLDVDEDGDGIAEDAQLHVTASYDGGLTFPVDQIINDDSAGAADDYASFGMPVVGPNGEVYVVWDDFSNNPNSSDIMFDVSTDAGANWGTDVLVASTPVTRGNANGFTPTSGTRYHIPAQPDRGVLAVPSIAVDLSGGPNHGRLFVSYTTVGDGGALDTDVVLRFSDDQGANWSGEVLVNDDGGVNSQFLPWVAADTEPGSGGHVVVGWYDARNDPANNQQVQTFLAISDDGGQTFRANQQIASGQSDQSTANPNRTGNNYLEYLGVAIHDNRICMAWADNSLNLSDLDFFSACLFAIDVPVITIPSDVFLDDTCSETTSFGTLYVCNTGTASLEVGPITSDNPRFEVITPSSGYPVVISPDFCFPFRVSFTPELAGDDSATFEVPSNDPISPTNLVQAFGTGLAPSIATFVPNSGNFGDVCVGSFRDLNLTINNPGGCTLVVTNVVSSSSEFVEPGVTNYPITIHPGDSVAVPIRFQPTSLGPKSGQLFILAAYPVSPLAIQSVSGNSPSGDVRVTGSTDFGDVCAGGIVEKTISVCNVGQCNLTVSNVAFVPDCADFILVNNPFPAVVSPDSCVDVVIRFTPTSCGSATCNLQVATDDPDTPVINLSVTANTPCGSIDVPPDVGFPPTVISSFGPCRSLKPFPISNTGTCPLVITDIAIGGPEATDYSLEGLPSFPIILEPGHLVGEGDLNIAFAPAAIDRDREATITVTYVSDPVSGATANVTRRLCGEGVNTGARVLVMVGGIPIANVEKIQLQRINANRNKKPLDTHDVTQDAPLTTVVPNAPCPPFQYHREYGTVSNPIQLLAGSYQVTVSAIVNGKRKNQTVGFDVSTCDFNPTIVINY